MPVCSPLLLTGALQALGNLAHICAFRETSVSTPMISDPGLIYVEDGTLSTNEDSIRHMLLVMGRQMRQIGVVNVAKAILSSTTTQYRRQLLALIGSDSWTPLAIAKKGEAAYLRRAVDGSIYLLATAHAASDGAYSDPTLRHSLWVLPAHHPAAMAALAGMPFAFPTEAPVSSHLSSNTCSPSLDAALRDLVYLLCEEGEYAMARQIVARKLAGFAIASLPAEIDVDDLDIDDDVAPVFPQPAAILTAKTNGVIAAA